MSTPRAARWLAEAQSVDEAVYAAVAGTDTPLLDGAMRRLSNVADQSRLSIAAAAVMAGPGGARGRRAAVSGLAAVGATSAVVNLALKPIARRRRPSRGGQDAAPGRNVRMPGSAAFPSGHSASAFAFASAAGRVLPPASVPLHLLAALVAYSRVHAGVHYPADVVAGALIGAVIADAAPCLSGARGPMVSAPTRARSRQG